jgi:hypothetical protein
VYIWLLLWLLVVGSFIWVYVASIRGLYEMGKKPLKLRNFHEDRSLGTRPIGLLSLTFASVYLFGMGLAIVLILVLLPRTTLPLFSGLILSLIILGTMFFFLPLYSVHKRMLEEKQLQQNTIRQQLSRVVGNKSGSDATTKELGEAIDRLTTILAVEVTKDDLANIPTWPVDAPIMSRLVTLIFSIIGILIANYLLIYILQWK